MSITHLPLREIAAEYPTATAIFEQFDIDLCAWGDKLLDETCAALRLSTDQMEEKLHALTAKGRTAQSADQLSLTRVIQLIVREHHRRIRQDLPALARMADKLAGKQPADSDKYRKLAKLIWALHAELIAHIEKEEHMIFPVIAELDQRCGNPGTQAGVATQSVRQPVAHMMREHAQATRKLDELRTLTGGLTTPANACATQRALYAGLRKFEKGFREHVHLENDILFPRSMEAESALRERSLA